MFTRYIGRVAHGYIVRIITTVMIVLILVVGCGKAEPTATPVPPTLRVEPTRLSSSQAQDEADTPVLPTATTVPPTDTSVPPTVTPTNTPVPPTATPAPPTATATPVPTATPVAESYFDGVRVTFVNNAGFLITAGDKRILIDALYEGYPEGVLKPVVYAQPPFDGVDLILATHEHRDHFSPDLVLRYMRNNPNAVFVSSQSAVDQVIARDGGIRSRVIPIQLRARAREQIAVSEIDLEIIHLSHGDPQVLNLGFIITVEGIRLFHTGDIDPETVNVSYLQSYGLPEKQIDIAFVSGSMLTMEEYHSHVLEGIQARYVIPMHYSYQLPPSGIEAYFPNAFVFHDTMESWVLP